MAYFPGTSVPLDILPFGGLHTESLTPIFQCDAVYALLSQLTYNTSTGSGTVVVDNGSFKLNSGTTIYSSAILQSRKRLRYRPGQGIVGRFTAIFDTSVADSYQLSGFGHSEDGIYFGYKNTDFGILYVNRGVREVRTLTITTASSGATNATITLNGTAFTVPLTASSNIQRTVYEISQFNYGGWRAMPFNDTVVFLRASAGLANSGAYTFSHATAVGAFVQTTAGVSSTDTFIAQADWNVDKGDGTGPSAMDYDWQKGNIFQIGIQFLGQGCITLDVADNSGIFKTVHRIELPNTLTASSFRNPCFPFTSVVYSAGSTTDLELKNTSFSGAIEGEKLLHGPQFTYENTITTATTTMKPIFTIMNNIVFKGVSNQAVINLLSVSIAAKHINPVTFYLIRNGALTGNPDFDTYDTDSCSLYDTSATGITYNNGQIIWSGPVGETGNLTNIFKDIEEKTLQPGEWVSLCVKSSSGNPSFATGTINTREDI